MLPATVTNPCAKLAYGEIVRAGAAGYGWDGDHRERGQAEEETEKNIGAVTRQIQTSVMLTEKAVCLYKVALHGLMIACISLEWHPPLSYIITPTPLHIEIKE